MELAAAFLAWLGASVVVLADGRRGLAAGVAIATAGLAAFALLEAGPFAAVAVAVGGAAAVARRVSSGPPGWSIMPAGSTPRLVACVAGGLVALWVGFAVMTGAGGGVRFAAMAAIGLAGARVLWTEDASVVRTALAVLAPAMAVAASLAAIAPGVWPYAAAALVAGAAAWIPLGTARAA